MRSGRNLGTLVEGAETGGGIAVGTLYGWNKSIRNNFIKHSVLKYLFNPQFRGVSRVLLPNQKWTDILEDDFNLEMLCPSAMFHGTLSVLKRGNRGSENRTAVRFLDSIPGTTRSPKHFWVWLWRLLALPGWPRDLWHSRAQSAAHIQTLALNHWPRAASGTPQPFWAPLGSSGFHGYF